MAAPASAPDHLYPMRRRTLLAAALLPPLGACQPDRPALQGGFAGPSIDRGHALRDAWQDGAPLPAPAVTRSMHTVIVGGGVAGLAAARGLLQAGIDDFMLLELEDSAGGNARSTTLGGMACPIGAHYLPVPGGDAPEVQALLAELGLMSFHQGRWQVTAAGERHLCHSPQERLWFNGRWQEGLLPADGVRPDTLAAYRRFAALVRAEQQPGKYRIPVARADARWAADVAALDAQTFAHWLDAQQLTDPHLRWYLDYCCRDDFGAPASTVSAWAGLHYFASRHGFHAPGETETEREGIFTWPEGNAWLTRALAQAPGERVRTGALVQRVEIGKHGVQIDWRDAANGQSRRIMARHCILATPLFISTRLLQGADSTLAQALSQAAAQVHYAPWLVANLQLDAPLHNTVPRSFWQRALQVDPPPHHAPPAWDNVLYGSDGLGYVDATHQQLDPTPGPTVLTHYRALGGSDMPAARRALLQADWRTLALHSLAELGAAHPDLPARTVRIDITRWGHAMACPVPGTRTGTARASLQQLPSGSRVQFAHSDLSGYSVFEEAFTQGLRAAGQVRG